MCGTGVRRPGEGWQAAETWNKVLIAQPRSSPALEPDSSGKNVGKTDLDKRLSLYKIYLSIYRMSRQWWQPGAESRGNWAGMTFGPGARFFEFGEVRLAILSLLKEGPKHGYQLMKEMTERSGGMYRASAGSIYPTLQQLEQDVLIESHQKQGRRVYRLTAAGRTELVSSDASTTRVRSAS